ncbi:MAG: tRNA (guanosine(37)-N1)-methyltransferase TrmD [Saprospiraceae bacterium]|nr:tRNA (guanosine(37)-N1)-methyltransferase TrmD [Saprospiraceae bacterium]MBK9722076.1 tRNA (guanosine(37)-N1)-methyltransferase TrmD [Saprospiraceae bacterium]MBK9729123.1 tRNA (guanosine(37)-N1)-methyltransferase TrmD [Saprospiraceae bacterium]
MKISIISIVPELLQSPLDHSIIKRAKEKDLFHIEIIDLRQFGIGAYRQVDDYQFGGGAGMVLMIEPLVNCIESLTKVQSFDEIIYLTPDGELLKQSVANQLSLKSNLLIICGHYKGIDERIRDRWITREISIGDYVLSGGELAACVLVDAIGRLLPGVLNDETSALTDSFQDHLLSPPVYSRPAQFRDLKVPDILLSGHQAKIDDWRFEQSVLRTKARRPDLLSDENI